SAEESVFLSSQLAYVHDRGTRPSRAQFPRRPPKGGGSCTSSPPSENIESEERLLRDRREGLGRHPRRMPCCLAPRPCARSDLLVSRRGCTDHRDTRRDVHAGTAEKVGPIERHAPRVTGDRDLLVLVEHRGIRVVTPRDFSSRP